MRRGIISCLVFLSVVIDLFTAWTLLSWISGHANLNPVCLFEVNPNSTMCFGPGINDTAIAIQREQFHRFMRDPNTISHIIGHLHSLFNTIAITYVFTTIRPIWGWLRRRA